MTLVKTIAASCLLMLVGILAGCAHQVYWNDVSGRGRGQSEFTMDDGNCRLLAQNARNQQQALVNQQNANGCYGTKAQCGTLGFLQGVSVGAATNDAYGACMNARGWLAQTRNR